MESVQSAFSKVSKDAKLVGSPYFDRPSASPPSPVTSSSLSSGVLITRPPRYLLCVMVLLFSKIAPKFDNICFWLTVKFVKSSHDFVILSMFMTLDVDTLHILCAVTKKFFTRIIML